ncbi:MAG: sugar-binding transcriptional regulator [Pseudomonadota bacterium]
MSDETDLMHRAAWLYYLGGLNQEETAARLGTTRARVNRLLSEAREAGVVSITIDTAETGLLAVEEAIAAGFGLNRVITTPELGLGDLAGRPQKLRDFPRRAVGSAAARLLRDLLAQNPRLCVGTGWGRTLDQMTRHLAGVRAPHGRFVSLMGSLTANSAFNPFDVVQALARKTGGDGHFLPVPFLADTAEDRAVLLSQRSVVTVFEMARRADVAFISVGELTEGSLLRTSGMISAGEMAALCKAGAVGDTNGLFFDAAGRPVDHALNQRTLAVGLDDLAAGRAILLAAGVEKVAATHALLRSGAIDTLIIDGDAARALATAMG